MFRKPYFDGLPPPYAVIQVRLDCAVRLFSNLADAPPDAVTIGARVTAAFEPASPEVTLLKFRLLEVRP